MRFFSFFLNFFSVCIFLRSILLPYRFDSFLILNLIDFPFIELYFSCLGIPRIDHISVEIKCDLMMEFSRLFPAAASLLCTGRSNIFIPFFFHFAVNEIYRCEERLRGVNHPAHFLHSTQSNYPEISCGIRWKCYRLYLVVPSFPQSTSPLLLVTENVMPIN